MRSSREPLQKEGCHPELLRLFGFFPANRLNPPLPEMPLLTADALKRAINCYSYGSKKKYFLLCSHRVTIQIHL